MAESYRNSYKKHISRNNISGNSSKRDTKQKNEYENRKKAKAKYTDSRTPPLPTMEDFSIEELLKKKRLIQDNLQKIKDHTPNEPKKPFKLERKRRYLNIDKKCEDSSSKKIKSKELKQLSPINNQDYIHNTDSEDEEYIIEQRRKQRKQLLEQLTGAKDNISLNEYKISSKCVRNSNVPHENTEVNSNTATRQNCTKEDITDMFSEMDEFVKEKGSVPENITQDNLENNSKLADNWDDAEGYYNIRIGDCINKNRYTIKSILGQGVFANVVRAQDNNNKSQDVAIKIIRNNELMQRTGLKEISILKEIDENDPDGKYHCVKLLWHFVHKGHLCLVLEPFYMDMRSILKKYGKYNGFNLKALMNYSRQLLLALKLLVKIGIIHADIKPDNILVNEKKNILKLCDFGSAAKIHENEPTPYLVSRFYRAPEIILGISYSHGVDIWSTACTIYEMATNSILFTGGSNNKMLKCFMDLKGKIPVKLLRKGKFKDQHFNYNNNFLLHKRDKITEREKVVEVSNINISRDLLHDLKKYFKKLSSSEEKKLLQLKDFLDKMLMLDEKQRLTVTDCLKHSFIHVQLK